MSKRNYERLAILLLLIGVTAAVTVPGCRPAPPPSVTERASDASGVSSSTPDMEQRENRRQRASRASERVPLLFKNDNRISSRRDTTPSSPAPPKRSTIGTFSVWDRLADCESGEWVNGGESFIRGSARWDDTRGMFEGGLQFHPVTWDSYRPSYFPEAAYLASREQQIFVAKKVLADQGWQAWPVCSRKIGVR